jgi:hypothetical protein
MILGILFERSKDNQITAQNKGVGHFFYNLPVRLFDISFKMKNL